MNTKAIKKGLSAISNAVLMPELRKSLLPVKSTAKGALICIV